jgi:glycosyltransferase involved in cell wall biosynthesis
LTSALPAPQRTRALRTLHLLRTLSADNGGPVTYWRSVSAAVNLGGFEAAAATPGAGDSGTIFSGGGGGGGVARFYRWLSQNLSRFDVVHIHGIFSWPLALGSPMARRARVPYVVSSHGHLYPWSLSQHSGSKKLYLATFLRRQLHRAAAIVATCDREATILRELDDALEVAVVPPGLPEWPRPRTTKSGVVDVLRLVFLNRIAPQKGFPTLLRAVASLRARGVRVRLDVVGDGSRRYCEEMRALSDELNLGDSIRWHGFLVDERRFSAVRDADVFVLASNMENFSFATAEALACGLPAVVSDQVALADEILRYECGRVVPVGDVEALANAISAYSSRELLEEQSGRALRCAEERFGLEAMNQGLLRTYSAALASDSHAKD